MCMEMGVAGTGVEVIERGRDEPGDIDLRNRTVSASPIRACTPASATAHNTLADFGIEKVKSNPATARRVLRAVSSATICATASPLAPGVMVGSRSAIRASIRFASLL